MEVLIKVQGQVATCQEHITLTASSGVLTAVFEFDESWEGMAKTALFTRNGVTETRLLRDDKCIVPDDVIKNGGLVVSVIGAVDGKILTTTNQCAVVLHLSGYVPGMSIGKPDEDVYTGILDLMAEHNKKAIDISENTAKAIEAQQASEKARDESEKYSQNAKASETNSKGSEEIAMVSAKRTEEILEQVELLKTDALEHANSARTSRLAAELSEANAKKSEEATKSSEKSAKTSENNAKLSEQNSERYAEQITNKAIVSMNVVDRELIITYKDGTTISVGNVISDESKKAIVKQAVELIAYVQPEAPPLDAPDNSLWIDTDAEIECIPRAEGVGF